MRAILLSDIHLGHKKDSDLYHQITKNLFSEIIDYCIRNDIKNIFILGDFFTNRHYLNIKTLSVGLEIGKMLANFNVYIIAGNHDIHFKNTNIPNSLEIFKDGFKHITIIDNDPLTINNCTLIPWGFYNLKSITTDFLFGHIAIQNFKMNDSSVCYTGIAEKEFSGFKHVYSGHFHLPSTNHNITYLGSPFQMSFADINSNRGFYEFNDGNLDFVEFNNYPKFYKFHFNEIDEDKINGNYIKVVFDEILPSKDLNEMLEGIMLKNPLELSTEYLDVLTNEEVVDDSSTEELTLSTYEIFKNYYTKINKPAFINNNILEKILLSLLKKE